MLQYAKSDGAPAGLTLTRFCTAPFTVLGCPKAVLPALLGPGDERTSGCGQSGHLERVKLNPGARRLGGRAALIPVAVGTLRPLHMRLSATV